MMCNMYWTLIIAKSLYASESWNTESIPCNGKGCIVCVTKENGELAPYEPSIPARKGLSIYKKIFGTSRIMSDIKKGRRQGRLTDRAQLPLTPGHHMIYKDLCLVFDILIGDHNLETEDFLVAPPKRENRLTRSSHDSVWIYNLKQRRTHHHEISIIRRHKGLVDFFLSDHVSMIEMKSLTRDQRKEKLRRMVEQLVTEDNKIRDKIWNGTFVPPNAEHVPADKR